MGSSQDRALQALSSELARLDWQITALLKSLVSSYAGRRRCHTSSSPTWSLGTPALQKAFQTFTTTPASLLVLQPLCGP
ncbi:hypothetical protein AOLI_G00200200 [Acnodon oligacanthus]